MQLNLGRKDVQVSMIDTAKTFGAVRSRPMLKYQRPNSPALVQRFANDDKQVLKPLRKVSWQICKGKNMTAGKQQQTAFEELAQRRHHYKVLVLVNDSGLQSFSQRV